MLRSLFSGITGLRAHQQMMDVTGNNIANVNTAGFKSSQAVFEDTLSQMLRPAGAPQAAAHGGTNPAQVGLGVRLAGISTNFSQGAAQATGRNTDLMISGDGFFVVRNGGEDLYTRAGAFAFDANGRLVSPSGAVVQGWSASNGVVDTNATPGDVLLPVATLLPPSMTKNVVVGGNLPANSLSTTPIVTSITSYDIQGNPITLSVTFTRNSATSWDVTVASGSTSVGPTTVTFAADGSTPSVPDDSDPLTPPISVTVAGVVVDLSRLTSYAGASTASAQSQDGYGMGSLQSFTIAPDGLLVGVFSNGLKQPLVQIALAGFNNPPGLEKVGDSQYRSTVNSGTVQLGLAGSGGRGVLQGGSVEMSNVDLAQEFTNLIIAQRGFQANSKVISTSDELLQDLVNLKR
jgi:flagellar hook protein FlgE